jgi:hypothetical protein
MFMRILPHLTRDMTINLVAANRMYAKEEEKTNP